MNVALVVHDFDPNFGHGRYAVELARRLAPHCDLRIYANRFAAAPDANVAFQRVPALRANALASVLTFIPAAERLLARREHDLVHAQGLTCWNADIITGHMCNAAKYKRIPPPSLRARLFPALVIPLERKFFQQERARHLIAISRVFADEIRDHYGWTRPTTVIHHGTDTHTFRPASSDAARRELRARYGLGPRAWAWLFMGEAVKGLRETIDQLAHFPDAELLVISRSDLDAFREHAARLGVAPRVRFHGFEPRPAQAFQAADVFVYPSGYDPFGLVVAEAMATALPVVTSAHIGVAEWIEHGRNGLLCDPAQPATLRAALTQLAADPALAARLGAAARATTEAHTWDACAARTLAVYEQVLRERRRP
jgi:glycosyltransferase involved in cell wall biosynthesis